MKDKGILLGSLLLFGLFIFMSLNWHSHTQKFTYHGEIWADRAGYHVYLPAAFDYHFDPDAFPEGIDKRTGNGFSLDSIPGRVITKYPCGEAMLRIPFYLVGKVLRASDDPLGAGFTLIDHAMIDIAASFYGAAGLLLLFWTLKNRIRRSVALATIFAILTGTNLLFYLIGSPGMSHVYSFFLFSSFLFIIDRSSRSKASFNHSFLLGILTGLIVVTRPTNIVFVPIAFLVTASTWTDVKVHAKALFRIRNILLLGIGAILMCIPQMLYWQYAFGSMVKWSYGSEGFTNALNPHLVQFWFSPHNGLFTYSPVLALILIAGAVRRHDMRLPNLGSWVSFLIVSYISASWFVWTFGCGYGSRNFVEYGAIFALPLGYLLDQDYKHRRLVSILVLACCIVSLKLTFSSDVCWFGGDWDWKMYFHFITGPFK